MFLHPYLRRLATLLALFLYRDPATAQWRVLTSYQSFKGGAGPFAPLGFGGDGSLFAVANSGQDIDALYTVNLATGKLNPEPVVVTPGYDFDGDLVRSGRKLLGSGCAPMRKPSSGSTRRCRQRRRSSTNCFPARST